MPATRRLPTRDELATWQAFMAATEALRLAVAARMQTEAGLSPGDYAVVLALLDADEFRMRSSELAAHVGWERSRLSHHLGRMERRGLIRRAECATDSRGAVVILERSGAEAFHAATQPHLQAVRELFVDALTPAQLAAADDLAAALGAHLARLRSMP